MLVLSRRTKEKVLFPGLGVSVQVVSVKGNVVRLGVEAPPEVAVLREELAGKTIEAPAPRDVRSADEKRLAALARQLQQRLKITSVDLNMVQLLLDAGLAGDARLALGRVRDEFQLVRLGLDGELEEEPKEVKKPAPARKALKALLVEDDQYQRELLAGVLRMGGVDVETAGDGCDALDHLRSHERPDVVLLDMGLPRCDGATVVRTVRNNPAYAGLRIFAVTGRAPAEFDLGAGPAGVDRWIRKPLDPTALLHDLAAEHGKVPCGV